VGIEGNSNNFVLMPSEGMKQFSRIRIPQLSCRIEAASYDFVSALAMEYPKGTLKARA
jgi:hypothetical protein